MTNPYRDNEPYQMWRRAVSRVEPHLIDPVVRPKFTLGSTTRVGTAGSCFAQHIARSIAALGFNYFVPEDGADLSARRREKLGYGVFSARYGNIYTVEQLMQLFEEVFDGRRHAEAAWERPDGRFIDPYRPRVEPDGFGRPEGVARARAAHLAGVERVFRETELFVFTLGLTEAWVSREDGAVFPLAPGVVGGTYDPARHAFHNFTLGEVSATLTRFLTRLREVNPAVRVLLTVSPVPLIATFEDRHVLVSTTLSKATLRLAAEEATKSFDFVDYFPSYEIITGSPTGGLYYEDDQREVNHLGVAHAMRVFAAHYLEGVAPLPRRDDAHRTGQVAPQPDRDVICDEEAIDTGID